MAHAPESDDVAIGYLRSALTVLVVLHHVALAYHPFAPPPGPSLDGWMQAWRAFPVVDAAKSSGATWLVAFDDTFFMSLMFAIAGLFVWPSLRRKGAARYLRDRGLRLGLPFLVAAGVLAPLAYYPAFLQTGGSGLGEFWRQWRAAGAWSIGPAWFLSLLLVFDLLVAGLFAIAKLPCASVDASATNRGGFLRWIAAARRHPVRAFLATCAVSFAAYVPLSFAFHGLEWTALGPLTFQTGRLLHYAAYFGLGVLVGAAGLSRGLFARDGALARSWPLWVVLGGLALVGSVEAAMRAFATGSQTSAWSVIASHAFCVACAALSFAMAALFVRFARPWRPLDHLRRHAYAIYLVHYPIVSWVLYAMLDVSLSGAAKLAISGAASLAASWAVATALVRVRPLARAI